MKNLAGHFGVAVAGAVSFAATVATVAVIERLTGFNFFTLSFWVVVPAGALLTGAAAASGYYFASLLLHTRPTWFMLVEVVIVAAASMVAIYYAEYASYVLDDGTPAASVVSFPDYLRVYLTSMHLSVGRGRVDTGEVGDFGYWLAVIEFAGFIAGGVFVWLMLRAQITCPRCTRYLRTLTRRDQQFSTQEEFTQYYDTLFLHPVDTPGFGELLRWQPRPAGKPVPGVIQSTSKLLGCPHCGDQVLSQTVQVMNGRQEWKDVSELTRAVRIPEGIDLRPAFRGPSEA